MTQRTFHQQGGIMAKEYEDIGEPDKYGRYKLPKGTF